jgi:hypothetical protein
MNMIKKTLFFFFFLSSGFLNAFYDEALDKVWTSIVDINNPTLEEYRLLDDYLLNKRRFLDISCMKEHEGRLNLIKSFHLLGPNGEMPRFERHSFNVTQNSKNRCIILYASHNGIYPEKLRGLLAELEKQGYSGHVLARIGGFPNTQNGGLKLCHIPYAFKLAFFQEARALGYKEVLWLDLSVHPLTNFDMLFSEIKRKGYFLTYVGTLQDNAPGHRPEAAAVLGISTAMYDQIPHLSSIVMGLNMESPQAIQLLDHWSHETEKVYGNVNWFAEELGLSIVAWRLNCRPFSWFGTIACHEHEVSWLVPQRPTIQMCIDARR